MMAILRTRPEHLQNAWTSMCYFVEHYQNVNQNTLRVNTSRNVFSMFSKSNQFLSEHQ